MADQLFPPVSEADWKAAAEAALKGASLSALCTETAEGIQLKPLYVKEDRSVLSPFPGEKPFTRGFRAMWSFPETNTELGIDPISSGAAAGVFPEDSALQAVRKGERITVNTVPYHTAGANAVQELALALSEAACFLKAERKEWETVSKWLFHFAAGTSFFTEIAKLRAFRTLWSAFVDIYQLEGHQKPVLSVETSESMLSVLDPHVNLLRTSSAVFAAVVGNVDYVKVSPFDQIKEGASSELAERMARNIPSILKHEALLDKVMDPAGGSYYIESLTEEIGRKAWDLFAEIEEAGGIKQALTAGTVQKNIEAVRAKKEQDTAKLRFKMIGVNHYADPGGQVQQPKKPAVQKAVRGEPIQPVVSKRTAEPFEALRLEAVKLRQTGQSLTAGLICFGERKTYQKRADYAAGVLSAGGIKTICSEGCRTIEEAVKFIQNHSTSYYCICGSDETYEQFGSSLASSLKKAANGAVIDSAGSQEVEGADGRIAAGDDMVKKLTQILAVFKGGRPA
ncbi:methylmalonyl-CoA mutase family protein [Domibacillus sp.]|uniref:methylmalonyl-CoA mutase family protein n=1 Tax=Domibacillus sp. TaxID=1969783 RepID=UPI002811FFFC|nr:methylmalonyl-CoA mutase family protein [Domibacillus sp.]